MVLELHNAEVKTKRKTLVALDNGPDTMEWVGADLLGQTRVTIPIEAITPHSRAAMQQLAKEMWQMGAIEDAWTFAAVADLPHQRDVVWATAPDVAKARDENAEMAAGGAPIPAPFDDHAIHIAQHNAFRKTKRYRLMPPERRKVVDDHIFGHENFGAEEAGRAEMQAGLSPALAQAPDASGGPPPEVLQAALAQPAGAGPPPPPPPPPEPEPDFPDEALDPDAIADQAILALMNGEG